MDGGQVIEIHIRKAVHMAAGLGEVIAKYARNRRAA